MRNTIELSFKPNLAALQASDRSLFPLLLNSASEQAQNARWDILFCSNGEYLELDTQGGLQKNGQHLPEAEFLPELDNWFSTRSADQPTLDALPFTGGWCLYLAYEFVGQIEPTVPLQMPQDGLPLALAIRSPVAIVTDRALGKSWIVAEAGYDDLADLVEKRILPNPITASTRQAITATSITEEDETHYLQAVQQAREYIAAGDVFQVNLSRLWQAELPKDVAVEQLWCQLNQANPSPFSGLLHWRQAALISSSPERLVSVVGPVVETRPIAGTRPRLSKANDANKLAELIANPKERAEHIMLLDLERNDLGRVCRPGTVSVDEFMGVESYEHVHHIVSNVRGRLRQDATPGKVLAAVFPGGTITGCPKVRCMQIVSELESGPRGAYTGSMGYLDQRGRLDMNILIRSMTLQGNTVSFRAGAGIVADSDPVAELNETRAKAKGLLRALGHQG